MSYQPYLLPIDEAISARSENNKLSDTSGTFVNNMKLPIHRWFRYSAGFSAEWVRHTVRQLSDAHPIETVLDPFAGSGTTLVGCNSEGIKSIGFESHPFIFRIANAKLHATDVDPKQLSLYLNNFLDESSKQITQSSSSVAPLLAKCYTPDSLSKLDAFKDLYLTKYAAGTTESDLLWLVITAILRSCSVAGTAQWQYVLPNKQKANVLDPVQAFQMKCSEVIEDIAYAQLNGWTSRSSILQTDARSPTLSEHDFVDAVITSPPYPNNYDYADATRLEMTFWGEISGWKDLQPAVRQYLIHSCSQHAAAERLTLETLFKDEILAPIHDELSAACHELAEIRLTKGGKKTYHTMAAAYFKDLGYVFKSLRHLCREGATVCFVIGDSAPYGVYLDVDKWLGQLAMAAGFKSYTFEKIRDRNTKWKNRKHTVPLKEGRLWIEG